MRKVDHGPFHIYGCSQNSIIQQYLAGHATQTITHHKSPQLRSIKFTRKYKDYVTKNYIIISSLAT